MEPAIARDPMLRSQLVSTARTTQGQPAYRGEGTKARMQRRAHARAKGEQPAPRHGRDGHGNSESAKKVIEQEGNDGVKKVLESNQTEVTLEKQISRSAVVVTRLGMFLMQLQVTKLGTHSRIRQVNEMKLRQMQPGQYVSTKRNADDVDSAMA